MTLVDVGMPGAAIADDDASSPITGVDGAASFAELAPQWLMLQNRGVATPYQTFDWTRLWCESAAAAQGFEPMLVACRNRRGRIVAILPLGLATRGGLRVASFLGGKHSNANMGVYDHEVMAALDAAQLHDVLRDAARRRGVDLYRFENQPFGWAGQANPMALLPHQPSPSSAWRTGLRPDAEAVLRGLMSYERGKKLRRKERKLAERGKVAFLEARREAETTAVLQAFLAQKAAKLRQLGIADPFAGQEMRAFLHDAAQPAEEHRPAISLFALTVGDRIVSVFGGAAHGGRFSGMFMSHDLDPEIARNSPGDLLIVHVIRLLCGRGFDVFDLGVGDAEYKKDYCPEEEPLFDSLLPMTAKGRAGAWAIAAGLTLKGAAKRSPLAAGLVNRVRRLLAR